ncbi:MAG: TatD family hydrolase [Candidatus Saccharimonas sp.]
MNVRLFDTHCHLHDSEFYLEGREEAYDDSIKAGVAMICVGTTVQSSREAIDFCASHEFCYPAVGIHPHEANVEDVEQIRQLVEENRDNIVAIGEIGLDYFYEHSPRDVQQAVLRAQLQVASDYDLPVSFHVRGAFDDFWPIFDEISGIRGVLHSFTDNSVNLEQALARRLKIGINGISTFTKDAAQQRLFRELSLEYILLETDAPFLTPTPLRGKVNIPANVELVAQHQAGLKRQSLDEVVRATTTNALELFRIKL